MSFSAIDLSTVPPPDVVEMVSYEALLQEMLDYLVEIEPTFSALVESDPAYKVLEVCAYFRLMDRQRVNDGARAVMLASSTGANLENLAALFGVVRKVADPGNPDALPPILPTMESDAALRFRTQLSLESLSVAGPAGAYIFHALSIDGVKDAGVQGPPVTDPGDVLVTILANEGSGEADSELVDAVQAFLSDEDVRPLTDNVTVQSATIIEYEVFATLYILPGPDSETVRAASLESVQRYVAAQHRVGADIRRSALYAAAHVGGVERVELNAPGIESDLVCSATEAPFCIGITLSTANA